MVKSLTNLEKIIFNYFTEEESAIFFATTDFYVYDNIKEGVAWEQITEDNSISAFVVTGESKNIVIARENTDFEELEVVLGNNFISSNKLPFNPIDKKYLLRKNVEINKNKKGVNYLKYDEIKGLDGNDNRDIVERKMYYHLKGLCEGALIENISGGFINFAPSFSIITDIFTTENHRRKGYGKQIVNKLLNLSKHKKVYLISQEHNLNFYEKLGFEKVKEIFEYKKENKNVF